MRIKREPISAKIQAAREAARLIDEMIASGVLFPPNFSVGAVVRSHMYSAIMKDRAKVRRLKKQKRDDRYGRDQREWSHVS